MYFSLDLSLLVINVQWFIAMFWLLKSDPETYSYDDLERDGKTVWDGVSNNLALKHIRGMKRGDLAFVYHSGEEKSIVAVAEIISDPYPDPKQHDPKLTVVNIRAKERLKRPVALAGIKARKDFADFALVRMSRLSVMPVTAGQWKSLLAMSHSG
jgi:predicted RNA-binding protein with PUA-like domain